MQRMRRDGGEPRRHRAAAPVTVAFAVVLVLAAALAVVQHLRVGRGAPASASTPLTVPAHSDARDALSCTGPVTTHDSGSGFGPRPTRRRALTDWSFLYEGSVPLRLLRPVDVQDGRELWAYGRNGDIKAAVVLTSRPRYVFWREWMLDSVAACDPSEFGDDADDAITTQVWSDTQGRRQPTDVIQSISNGPQHCNWGDVSFLSLHGPERQFLRDPSGKLTAFERTTYAADVTVPPSARDTGFRRLVVELWETEDAAYLVQDGRAQRWPRTTRGVGCV